MILEKKKIVLGVTGGISCYKSIELLRMLSKNGAQVHVVLTRNSSQFISPLIFKTLSGFPVHLEMFNSHWSNPMAHIDLAADADLLLVAPATANIIGKFANGIADDLLSTIFLTFYSQVLIAPAMNHNMYNSSPVSYNIKKLRNYGIKFIGPEIGELACGVKGDGRLSEVGLIYDEVVKVLKTRGNLEGKKILITAGPTREHIDPVRYITNPSSGKMGYAIAEAASKRGGEVVLITGKVEIPPPVVKKLINVDTAKQMREVTLKEAESSDIVIMAAAVSDYSIQNPFNSKIKKEDNIDLTLKLIKNKDILAEIGEKNLGKVRIGFAAETDNLIENAKSKLNRKNLNFIVANNVSDPSIGFGSDYNTVTIIQKDKLITTHSRLPKTEIAHIILDKALIHLNKK